MRSVRILVIAAAFLISACQGPDVSYFVEPEEGMRISSRNYKDNDNSTLAAIAALVVTAAVLGKKSEKTCSREPVFVLNSNGGGTWAVPLCWTAFV